MLNHFHFLDSGRDGRRPLTFSRYAGSAATATRSASPATRIITWASLDFQPYFTATASNVGYGWWSHDVGGHIFGYSDDELATRWVQLGVFSPILRLHSSDNPFITKEPWLLPGERARRVMSDVLRLRHRLVPYLHTMNHRAHADGVPLVQPMYYLAPGGRRAPTECRTSSRSATELLVAPITTPRDPVTLRGAVRAWLPPGTWIDVFTGPSTTAAATIVLHRDLDSIPVLAARRRDPPAGGRGRPRCDPQPRAASRCSSRRARTASSR